MNSVDLLDQADVLASKLSGGQKRKLSVAMALIGDPKVSGGTEKLIVVNTGTIDRSVCV